MGPPQARPAWRATANCPRASLLGLAFALDLAFLLFLLCLWLDPAFCFGQPVTAIFVVW